MTIDQAPSVETVVVRAINLPAAAGDAAFSIIRLSPQDLTASPRLDQVLETAPGVSLFRRTSSLGANPTTQGVSLRAIAGSGASRALVTLDGVPQNDPFGGWVIWTAIPTIGLADARVIRGAGSGPYGAGALTGVIALDSKEDPKTGALEASLGDLGFRQIQAVEGGEIFGVKLIAEGAAEHSDGWIPVRQGRGAADRPLSLEAESAAIGARTEVADAVLSGRVSGYQETRGAGVVGAGSRVAGGQASLTLTRQPTSERLGWRVEGWADASDLVNSSSTIAPGRNTVTPANDQYATPALGWGANGALRWTPPMASIEVGADVRGAAGESRERFSYVGSAFTKGRKAGGETLIGGLYAEGSKTFGATVLTGGVRIDEWADLASERVESLLATGATTLDQKIPDRSGAVPTGRVGIEHSILPWLAWRAAAYAGFRPATLNELHRPFRVGNNVTEANAELKPERLEGVETGLEARAGDFRASATLFVNKLENAITNVTIGRGPGVFPVAGFVGAGGILAMRENAGVVNANGLEAEASESLADGRLVLTAAIALTRSRVDGGSTAPQLTGRRPALTPGSTAVFGALVHPTSRFSIDLALRYESARYDDDLNTLRLRAATTLDGGADYAFRPNVHFFLRADNLLNAAIQTQETTDHIYSYGPPRMVRIGVRLLR
jgi:outer membrane receptor protein involved in Fe transport